MYSVNLCFYGSISYYYLFISIMYVIDRKYFKCIFSNIIYENK